MSTPSFVHSFREAAPYIHAFRGRVFVIAFDGDLVAQGLIDSLSQDINLLVSLGVRVVLVHGVRAQVAALLAARGLPTDQLHQHRRVTDLATLEAVKQAVGSTRAEIEAQLSMALPSSPMAGADLRVAGGNFIVAQPLGIIDGVDMLFTGQVRKIATQAIRSRLEAGDLVMLSPLGYSPTGEIFNLHMADVATQTAIALQADKLIFLVDTPGVQNREQQLVRELSTRSASMALQHGDDLPHSIRTPLECAVSATRQGIKRCHIINRHIDGALIKELFSRQGCGTMVSPESLEQLREANIDDIATILSLIEPLETQGILVKRSRELLEIEIQHYSVIVHDGMVTGCVALHPFPESRMAEMACLVVGQSWRAHHHGDKLLHYVEQRARAQGLHTLFVLTTQTAHWFIERGFVLAELAHLPMRKRELYNYQRRSQVFVKPLD